MMTSFDLEEPIKVQTLYDVSEIIQCLAYFNVDKLELYTDFVTKLS